MNRATTFVTGALAGLATVAGLRYYRSRATQSVAYEHRRLGGGVELRQYPTLVVAETVAETADAARNRLQSYLTGANVAEATIPPTTPTRTNSQPVALTTPTAQQSSTPVRVGAYLPPTYSPQTAPTPTNTAVTLTVETPRTIAVRSVPWYRRSERFERAEKQLLSTVETHDLVAVGSPFVFNYDNSLRGSLTGRTEVAIEVA